MSRASFWVLEVHAGPRICTIVNKRGLHARATARLVKLIEEFDARVTITKDGMSVSGDSILGLMTLGAGQGSELVIEARGTDAEAVLAALADLIARGFDEDISGPRPTEPDR